MRLAGDRRRGGQRGALDFTAHPSMKRSTKWACVRDAAAASLALATVLLLRAAASCKSAPQQGPAPASSGRRLVGLGLCAGRSAALRGLVGACGCRNAPASVADGAAAAALVPWTVDGGIGCRLLRGPIELPPEGPGRARRARRQPGRRARRRRQAAHRVLPARTCSPRDARRPRARRGAGVGRSRSRVCGALRPGGRVRLLRRSDGRRSPHRARRLGRSDRRAAAGSAPASPRRRSPARTRCSPTSRAARPAKGG